MLSTKKPKPTYNRKPYVPKLLKRTMAINMKKKYETFNTITKTTVSTHCRWLSWTASISTGLRGNTIRSWCGISWTCTGLALYQDRLTCKPSRSTHSIDWKCRYIWYFFLVSWRSRETGGIVPPRAKARQRII